MSIALAMELPVGKLQEWTPLADLDFIIATAVLKDKEYAEHFAHRPLGRELIMDNGLHEEGIPLSLSDLLEAALRCRADYIVTPDRTGDIAFNTEQFLAAQRVLVGFKLCVVMTIPPDHNPEVREKFLYEVRDADMLAPTFKEPERLRWYRESVLAKRWARIHLLGLDSFEELSQWVAMSRLDTRYWSIDTGKCFKHAMQDKSLSDLTSLRGAPLHSKDLLHIRAEDITPAQDTLFRRNVETLRQYLR